MTAVLTHGADPDALERLADELLHTAERIALIGRHHLDALTALQWRGPDADRARAQWAYLFVAAIRPTSMALAEASGAARQHAAQQRQASEAAGPGGATPSAAGPAAASSAAATPNRETVRDPIVTPQRIRDLLMTGPELATVVTAARTWENGLDLAIYPIASDILNATPIARGGGAILTGAGLIIDGHALAGAIADGDAAGAVIPGTGLALGIAGVAGVGLAAPAGAAWGGGTTLGGMAYDAMQGTRYGDIVQSMTDEAFREHGAWGIAQVPGILGFAGYERLREALTGDD